MIDIIVKIKLRLTLLLLLTFSSCELFNKSQTANHPEENPNNTPSNTSSNQLSNNSLKYILKTAAVSLNQYFTFSDNSFNDLIITSTDGIKIYRDTQGEWFRLRQGANSATISVSATVVSGWNLATGYTDLKDDIPSSGYNNGDYTYQKNRDEIVLFY